MTEKAAEVRSLRELPGMIPGEPPHVGDNGAEEASADPKAVPAGFSQFFAPDFLALWNEKEADGNSFSSRASASLNHFRGMARAAGKPLTVADAVQMKLFGYDDKHGHTVECQHCAKKFCPRWWALTDSKTGTLIVDNRFEDNRPLCQGNHLFIMATLSVVRLCDPCILEARTLGFRQDGEPFVRDKPLPTMTWDAAHCELQREIADREEKERAKRERMKSFSGVFGIKPR